jgi:hypothetical protein
MNLEIKDLMFKLKREELIQMKNKINEKNVEIDEMKKQYNIEYDILQEMYKETTVYNNLKKQKEKQIKSAWSLDQKLAKERASEKEYKDK